ncbi:MAG TPA: hypothetical protein PK066_14560, partial [Saprospiraceae bacterium]|nr:hypothetical protein [Saprospiraceae bacterium]
AGSSGDFVGFTVSFFCVVSLRLMSKGFCVWPATTVRENSIKAKCPIAVRTHPIWPAKLQIVYSPNKATPHINTNASGSTIVKWLLTGKGKAVFGVNFKAL